MTDQAPAYAIAVDQLQARAEAAEKERDALKLENDMLNEQLEAAYPGMLRRMESAEKERDELRAQLEAATAAREGWRTQYDQTAALLHAAKCRIADLEAAAKPRTFTALEEQTGPVAFERNQLRDELAQLRAKHEQAVTELNAGYDTLYDELTRTKADRDKHEHRATMHERDAERMARAADTLETMFNAAISAVSRGNP